MLNSAEITGWRTPNRLLTAPFTGSIDDWKFTRKVLTAKELDWSQLVGLAIFLR